MLVFWYFVLENTAPPVVEPPGNGGFVLMKHYMYSESRLYDELLESETCRKLRCK